MSINKITVSWLQKQKYFPQNVYKEPTIKGVVLKELTPMVDGRGDIIELWSKPWIKKDGFVTPVHCYQTSTKNNVIKAWHLHAIHTDQLTITRGKIQIVLVDVRKRSPTFAHVNSIFSGTQKPRLVKVPPGIMHGWKALSSPEVLVVNLQTQVFDPKDEYRFPWNCVLEDIWEPKNG
jgi:dTDP-4-dehydrorhamnose 3,5-epimerase